MLGLELQRCRGNINWLPPCIQCKIVDIFSSRRRPPHLGSFTWIQPGEADWWVELQVMGEGEPTRAELPAAMPAARTCAGEFSQLQCLHLALQSCSRVGFFPLRASVCRVLLKPWRLRCARPQGRQGRVSPREGHRASRGAAFPWERGQHLVKSQNHRIIGWKRPLR